uniref:Cadherin domain-containing protein n=1 Tax=Trichobilharzia regenti TaxID=157069 RepID=A0AA85ILQ3_TRIRE|nr:unnamed protein product [Trichobilharzia regenti]
MLNVPVFKSVIYGTRKYVMLLNTSSPQEILLIRLLFVVCVILLVINPSLTYSTSLKSEQTHLVDNRSFEGGGGNGEDKEIGLVRHPRLISTSAVAAAVAVGQHQSRLFSYEVVEESKRGTFVGNIITDLLTAISSDPKYATTTNDGNNDNRQVIIDPKSIHLSITNWRESNIKHFILDRYTGELRVAIPPDREVICQRSSLNMNTTQQYDNYVTNLINNPYEIQGTLASNDPCIVILQIAYNIQKTSTEPYIPMLFNEPGLIAVNIRILDINDNAPRFPQSRLLVELGEITSIPEKSIIEIPTAYDPDCGRNGSIIYWLGNLSLKQQKHDKYKTTLNEINSIEDSNSLPFRLENNPSLRLVLTQSLNWESIKEYSFQIYAKDMGEIISLTGHIDIHVSVRDENDNPPKFIQSAYSVTINESTIRGSLILELQATDEDGASNGQLTFSLAAPSNMQERLASHHFGIRTISPQKAAIFIIQTPDVDSVRRNALTERRNKIDNHIHSTNDAIDLNERYQVDYVFHVIVRDNGYPRQLSSRAEITVHVLDVNDMSPSISISYLHTSSPKSVTGTAKSTSMNPNERISTIQNTQPFTADDNHGLIAENTPKGFIAFVNVQDLDSGVWGQVECYTDNDAFELIPVSSTGMSGLFTSEMSDNQNNFLTLNNYSPGSYQSTKSTDGEYEFKLFSTKPFDREKTSDVFFHIICVDNPQSQYFRPSPSSPSAAASISAFSSSASSSMKHTQSIYQTGEYTSQYFRQSPTPTLSYFTRSKIGSNNNNNNQLTGTALVRVFIADDNDNKPQFTRDEYTFSIDEIDAFNNRNTDSSQQHQQTTLPNPILIGKVTASDKDTTGQLKYFIPVGNDDNNNVENSNNNNKALTAFSVHNTDGSIYANQLFDREDIIEKYKLNEKISNSPLLTIEMNSADQFVYLCFPLYVTDGLYNASTKIRVLINDINDNLPIFEKANYEFNVVENEQPMKGIPIGVIKASDLDNSGNENIIYQLFDIDSPTILSSSAFSSSLSSNVSSMLQHDPIQNLQHLANTYFTISMTSGQLHLIRKLDREYQSHHIFYVLAIDNPLQSSRYTNTASKLGEAYKTIRVNTATATVTVIVTDVNDNPPTITYPSPHEIINIEAGAPAGHNLFTVLAQDPDAGENGTIRFSLTTVSYTSNNNINNNNNKLLTSNTGNQTAKLLKDAKISSDLFTIDETSGIVFLTDKLTDYSANYLVLITAQDMGYAVQRKTTTTVTIRVQNSNLLQALNAFKQSQQNPDEYGDYAKFSDIEKQQLSLSEYNVNSPESSYLGIYSSPSSSSSMKTVNSQHINNNLLNSPDQLTLESENRYGRLSSINRRTENRYINLSDQTIIITLASIFLLLFFTTLILICLIKRRRDVEQRRLEREKNNYNGPTNNIHGTQTRLASPASNSLHCSNSPKYNELNNLPNLYPLILHDKFDSETTPRTDFNDQPEDYDSTNMPRIYETSHRNNSSTPNLGMILSSNGYQELYSPNLLDSETSARRNPLDSDSLNKTRETMNKSVNFLALIDPPASSSASPTSKTLPISGSISTFYRNSQTPPPINTINRVSTQDVVTFTPEQHRQKLVRLKQVNEVNRESGSQYQTINSSFITLPSGHHITSYDKMKSLKYGVNNTNLHLLPYLTELTNNNNKHADVTQSKDATSVNSEMTNKPQQQQQTFLFYDVSADNNQKDRILMHNNQAIEKCCPNNQSEDNSTLISFKQIPPSLKSTPHDQVNDNDDDDGEKTFSTLSTTMGSNTTQKLKNSSHGDNNRTNSTDSQSINILNKASSLKRNTTMSKGVSFV